MAGPAYPEKGRRIRIPGTTIYASIVMMVLMGVLSVKNAAAGDRMQIGPRGVSSGPGVVYEIYPDEESVWGDRPDRGGLEKPPAHLPVVAIIVDDIGYDLPIVKKFLDLGVALTFSILPYGPFGRTSAELISKENRELMLHLPMEPVEYPEINPGPDALLSSMSPEQMTQHIEKYLTMVPEAAGVNNHMGSKFTALPAPMYQVLSVLKSKGLFFIDSRTSPVSSCEGMARVLKIPFGYRDVFLDHTQSVSAVRKQITLLIHLAETYGEAVGIGHPHDITYRVLREQLPVLKKKVFLVPASRIVRTMG